MANQSQTKQNKTCRTTADKFDCFSFFLVYNFVYLLINLNNIDLMMFGN